MTIPADSESADNGDNEIAIPPDPWPPYSGADTLPPGDNGRPLASDALCEWVRERTGTVLVGLSFGKDSLAVVEQLLRWWPRSSIAAYTLAAVPNLEFQRRSAAYYRRALGIPIIRMPHRSTYRYLRTALFTPPNHRPAIIGAKLPEVAYESIYAVAAEVAGFDPATTWVATGVRSADSPLRRVVIARRGPADLGHRSFYPIHDWYKCDVVAALDRLGVALPVDYRLWGRTLDGLDHRFMAPLAAAFPDDYARVRRLFPLVELEWVRRGLAPPQVPDPDD